VQWVRRKLRDLEADIVAAREAGSMSALPRLYAEQSRYRTRLEELTAAEQAEAERPPIVDPSELVARVLVSLPLLARVDLEGAREVHQQLGEEIERVEGTRPPPYERVS